VLGGEYQHQYNTEQTTTMSSVTVNPAAAAYRPYGTDYRKQFYPKNNGTDGKTRLWGCACC